MLKGKKILIGITGSIAAYKIPLLIRILKKEGAEVKVVVTPQSIDFVTPLTLATLSGNPVLTISHDAHTGVWNSHVELGLWADVFLIAPLSANTMAKMAGGIADNYLLTVYLSARCAVFAAPAMDLDMYKHPTVKQNVETLRKNGVQIIEPRSGELASGLCGEGRMEEPEEIFTVLRRYFASKDQFQSKKVLITAGPTHEPIDPVRFIGNHSSGRMGYEIARAFAGRGAAVTLISGPTDLRIDHPAIHLIPVTTAAEMFETATLLFTDTDVAVLSAAVADYTPASFSDKKIKKQDNHFQLELIRTKDILAQLGKTKTDRQYLVGFALETDHAKENALQKLRNKNLDLIVLNSMEDAGAGFRHETNKVSLIERNEKVTDYPLKSKKEVADDLVDFIARQIL